MIDSNLKPSTVGEVLTEEFMEPYGLTQEKLALAMGVPRKHVNEICNNKRSITIDTAMILERVFDMSAQFWLNLQLSNDVWNAKHSPERMARIARAKPFSEVLGPCRV